MSSEADEQEILTDIRLSTKEVFPHVVQGVKDLLGPLPRLALEPGDALVLALLLGTLLDEDIYQTHAQNLAVGHVNGLVGVLGGRTVPPLEGTLGVGLTELSCVGVNAGEEDLEHDLAHTLALEGGEVGLVHTTDVGDEGGKNSDDHFGGCLGCLGWVWIKEAVVRVMYGRRGRRRRPLVGRQLKSDGSDLIRYLGLDETRRKHDEKGAGRFVLKRDQRYCASLSDDLIR